MIRCGFANQGFNGDAYHSHEPGSVYLILEKGTAVVMDEESEVDGWVWAHALVGSEWKSGWMPYNLWCVKCPLKLDLLIFWRILDSTC